MALNGSGRLRIASHFPGRLRVRATAFRDVAFANSVAEKLREEDGVVSASTSALTGSLLVAYDARTVQLPWLVQLIVKFASLDGIEADHDGLPPPKPQGPAIREALDRWNGSMVGATDNRLDAKTAIPGVLAGLGVLKLLFGNRRLPEWYDLMFWSITMFVNLNPPNPMNPRNLAPEDDGNS